MRHPKHSLLGLMLIALFLAGMIGFSEYEQMNGENAFHATISALTFSSDSTEYSSEGKMLNSFMSLAIAGVIVWAIVNFHHFSNIRRPEPNELLKFIPKDDGAALKEITIQKGSHLEGLTKVQILRKTGTVVFAIFKGGNFQLSVAFSTKLSAGTKALFLGTPEQLKEIEKESQK